jgi:hypothetical protein
MTWVGMLTLPVAAGLVLAWLFCLSSARWLQAWVLSYVAQGVAVTACVLYLCAGLWADAPAPLLLAGGLVFTRWFLGPDGWRERRAAAPRAAAANERQYAACRKCGDPIERGNQRLQWRSLRALEWPLSCSRPWWRLSPDHEPGREMLTGDAATDAWLAYLSSGERTQQGRWRRRISPAGRAARKPGSFWVMWTTDVWGLNPVLAVLLWTAWALIAAGLVFALVSVA